VGVGGDSLVLVETMLMWGEGAGGSDAVDLGAELLAEVKARSIGYCACTVLLKFWQVMCNVALDAVAIELLL
jgi:hypothetical protein